MTEIQRDDDVQILVVDDDVRLAQATVRLLRQAGYEVFEAHTGSEGQTLAEEKAPALILLDVMLPDVNGLEICQRIKANPALESSLVVMLSGHKTAPDEQAVGLEQGADDYIVRPISNRELLARVGALLRIQRAEKAMAERLHFETLLSELSATFVNLPTAEVDRVIEQSLKRIVEFLNVDRGTLSEFLADGTELRATHSYARPGYESAQNWPLHTNLPWYTERLLLEDIIVAEYLPDELPAEAHAERAYCVQSGLKSHLSIPLVAKGMILGALGFTAFDTFCKWADDLVQRLRLIGEIFANALLLKRREEALMQHAQALEHANAELERFSYIMAHHLQEPLRNVTGFAQLLVRHCSDQCDDKMREYITFIMQSTTQAKQLLRDLLVYTKLDQTPLKREEVDSDALIQDILMRFRAVIVDTSATVTHDVLPTLKADAARLTQVFEHLIDNACKFSADEPTQVHIAVRKEPGAWLFSISDKGIGIETAYEERIFRIFERLHTQQVYPGTGIGLAICKKIVEGHGGQIWVESEIGEGSTFYFTIPVA